MNSVHFGLFLKATDIYLFISIFIKFHWLLISMTFNGEFIFLVLNTHMTNLYFLEISSGSIFKARASRFKIRAHPSLKYLDLSSRCSSYEIGNC